MNIISYIVILVGNIGALVFIVYGISMSILTWKQLKGARFVRDYGWKNSGKITNKMVKDATIITKNGGIESVSKFNKLIGVVLFLITAIYLGTLTLSIWNVFFKDNPAVL